MPGERCFVARMVFFVWLDFFSYCHRCSQDLLCSHDRTGSQPQPLEINRNVECIAIDHTDFFIFFLEEEGRGNI